MATKPKRADRKRVKLHFRIYCGDEIALGPGKAELLHHISKTGSISEAARRMGMSYNRAWLLVRTMNGCFKEPLVQAARGGEKRGGAQLTKNGERVLALYQESETRALAAAQASLARILPHLQD